MRTCSIKGCDGKHESHGFCSKHAQRFRRYGDPFYITPEHVLRENSRKAQLKRSTAKPTTYKKLYGRHEHRVVAEIKIGRKLRPGEIVHHIDGNKHNNDPSNLEVLKDQTHHVKKSNGIPCPKERKARGSKSGVSKAVVIDGIFFSTMTQAANIFKCSNSRITRMVERGEAKIV